MVPILVLGNNLHTKRSICEFLNSSGFSATECLATEQALRQIGTNSYELIIAEEALSESNIFDFVRNARVLGNETPILFISEREGLPGKNITFRLGTDDYMDQPIILEELLMRVRAILRRSNEEAGQKIRVGSLEMDPVLFGASVNGEVVHLSAIEFQILYKLLLYSGRALSRAQLVAEVWGIGADINERLIDTYICKLRGKFSKCDDFKIVSVRTRGYMAVPGERKRSNA